MSPFPNIESHFIFQCCCCTYRLHPACTKQNVVVLQDPSVGIAQKQKEAKQQKPKQQNSLEGNSLVTEKKATRATRATRATTKIATNTNVSISKRECTIVCPLKNAKEPLLHHGRNIGTPKRLRFIVSMKKHYMQLGYHQRMISVGIYKPFSRLIFGRAGVPQIIYFHIPI